MASLYGIITITELENDSWIDFSEYVDGAGDRLVSDTRAEALITKAERRVIKFTETEWDSSAPANIKDAVLTLAGWYCKERLQEWGYFSAFEPRSEEDINKYLDAFLTKDQAAGEIKEFESVEDY